MTTWASNDIDTFWGLSDDLASAISQWQNDRDENAALNLAICIGHCRLYGIEPESSALQLLDVEVPKDALFYSTWREIRQVIDFIEEEADGPQGLMISIGGGIESRSMTLDILQSRLAFEGLRIVLEHVVDTVDPKENHLFRIRIDVFHQVIHELDEAIDAHPEEFALASETAWPHNVQMTLGDSTWRPRPWWLTTFANTLLEDQRALVKHLMDAGLSGTVKAVTFDAPMAIRSNVNQAGEMVSEPTAELQLAADNSSNASLYRMVELRSATDELSLSSTLFVSRDYAQTSVTELPTTAKCLGRLRIALATKIDGTSIEDEEQVWRLRWGQCIHDVPMKRLQPLGDLGGFELQGTFDLDAKDVQRTLRNDGWSDQYWRRLS